jgi:hypothetical protein
MTATLTRWIVFSVVIALLPICFAYVYALTIEKPDSTAGPSIKRTVVHGELLLVSVALAADAMGEVIGTGQRRRVLKYSAGGGCLICIICSSLYFAVVSVQDTPHVDLVFWISVGLFTLTLLSAGVCKTLADIDY